MISAIEAILKTIYATIPREILNLAFQPSMWQVTLDQRIKDAVIIGRVHTDCNIYAGQVARIPLDSSYLEDTRQSSLDMSGSLVSGHAVYRIPASARQYRDITGVITLSFPYEYTAYSDSPYGLQGVGNTMAGFAKVALSSRTHSNQAVTPVPLLQKGNMIVINPPHVYVNNWVLVCRLGHDDEFTNIGNSSIRPLARLTLEATKAYIYRELIVKIDAAYLSGGQELGVVKSIVESYADANEKYEEALKEMRSTAVFDESVQLWAIKSAL